MAADVNYIQCAMEGRRQMLRAIFGGTEPAEKRKMTGSRWRSIVDRVNAKFRKGRGPDGEG
jgi:hypothetical protein